MSTLDNLYKQVILDHSRKPRHFGELSGATNVESGHNPSCGDHVQLMLRLDGDVIADAGFTGKGCAISVASASLMTSALRGKTVAEAAQLEHAFLHMIRTGEPDPSLGDLMALQGVHALHTRVKCATLVWQTLDVLLRQVGGEDTTPDAPAP
ncbi:Fe-S cluster assembly sulfur transfer protein SufU [uncultured Deinococcus sp.]|uniref:Fe-S cluster assembly sulfur transfer protein SufU n=1 Tax=uncultured Deinococcus sp. TaxID=158789 RepID=UPI0025F8EA51|nr:SUF system NifU family Fe-S cluster assembly protein [uncultured Deinococcus sp.]